MCKKLIAIFLISISLIGIVFAQGELYDFPQQEESKQLPEQPTQEIKFENNKAQVLGEGTINGVPIKPGYSRLVPLITKTSQGYGLDGEVILYEDFRVSNVNQLKIEQNSVRGIAGEYSTVGFQQLTPGTEFIYNKAIGMVIIKKGGSIYHESSFSDKKVLVTAKEGDIKFPAGGGFPVSEGLMDVELGPGSSIELSHQAKGTLGRYTQSKYFLTSLSDKTRFLGLENENIRIMGDVILTPTERFDQGLIRGYGFERLNEYASLHGTTEVRIDPENNQLIGLVFNKDGQSSYYRKYQSTDVGPVLIAYTNGKPDGSNAESGVFFKTPYTDWTKDLDGYALVKPFGSGETIDAKGIVSISARTVNGENFRYSGTDPQTEANLKTQNGILTGDINHPSIGKTGMNNDIATVNMGSMTSVYGLRDGELKQLVPTRSVFVKGQPVSFTDVSISPATSVTTTTPSQPVGPIIVDSEQGGILGFKIDNKGVDGITITSPQIDLASQEDLSRVSKDLNSRLEDLKAIVPTSKTVSLSSVGTAVASSIPLIIKDVTPGLVYLPPPIGYAVKSIFAVSALIGFMSTHLYGVSSEKLDVTQQKFNEIQLRQQNADEQRQSFQKIEQQSKGK